MTLETWLRNRAVWLVTPVLWSNLLTGALVLAWALSSSHFVATHHRQLFATSAIAIGSLTQLIVVVAGLTRLRTFRALASGRATLNASMRLAALGELRTLPGTLARYSIAAWLIGAALLAISAVTLNDAAWSTAARLLVAAILSAPLATTLLSLLVTARSWDAFDRLADGLSPAEVIAAAPATEWSIRGRTVMFTIVFTVVPLLMVGDLAWEGFLHAPAALSAVAPAERVALADTLFRQLAFSLLGPALIAVAFAMFAANAAGKTIAHPMQRLAEDANSVTNGTLRTPRVIAADGEVWRVTGIFALLCERLTILVEKVVDVGLQVRTASEALQHTSTRSEATATEQAAALNETSATTEELARSARQIAQSAASVQDLARRTLEAAEQGRVDAGEFQTAVDRMKQDNRSIADAVDRLQRRVQQIGRIVELINTVADRSDLLALSAELEGSRAGEVGRGFSLVGAEMRRLAENVLESTSEVEELIGEIREATVRTADATAQSSRLTEHGMTLAGHVTGALTRVAELASDTATRVRTISLSTQQQQSGTDQLAESMAEILRTTRAELDATHRTAQVNQELVALASSLQSVVSRFLRTEGGGSE